MKKFLIIFIVIVLGGLILIGQKGPELALHLADGTYCYHRLQEATDVAPYRVEENIVLNINGNTVTGRKEGTQAGPDMTNGFFGDLNGTRDENNLELLYSFTIESSQNAEREVYKMNPSDLTKFRWPLKEEGGFLAPDRVGEPTLIVYEKVECPTPAAN